MLQLVRTNSHNEDFRRLVPILDMELAERDGEDAAYYAQYNKVDKIPHVVVAYLDGEAVGCGAFKKFDDDTAEVKRMFVAFPHRRRGIAEKVLHELEQWARELSYSSLVLETGIVQPEALGLYSKSGYRRIPNYGQYANMPKSVCFQKTIQG
jgi:GNAT superfamily N-acetyltransferase